MIKHKKIYLKFYDYDEGDDIQCEVCPNAAVDIHHIFARQMGGSLTKDFPFNLMALCRTCHDKYGDKVKWFSFLLERKFQISDKERTEIKLLLTSGDPLIFRNQEVTRKFIYYL